MSQNKHLNALEQLIKGCVNGDHRSQKLLYETYSSRLYAVCLRYMSSREEAQDVLQDSFVKIFNKIGSYNFEGAFEGWLRRVVVNTALEQLRRNKHKFEERFEEFEPDTNFVTNEAEGKIEVEALMKSLQSLAIGYRTVFNLYVVEGFTHAEIANQLGMSEATSKSQLSRAKKILQNIIIQQHVG
jgi:RNA polymerase sigma-70 factor (ECF subfamily)